MGTETLFGVTFDTRPTMLASWPGMGNVGIMSVDYVRRMLGARPFAAIDMSEFFTPDNIIVEEGVAKVPQLPSSAFYYHKNPDIIFFESDTQIGGKEGITILQAVLEIARQLRVVRIITAAALAEPISHTAPSRVYCVGNNKEILEQMETLGTQPLHEGAISGQNGVLLSVAQSKHIDAACLLGTIPSYAANISYPKAAIEVISVIKNLLGITLDLIELESAASELDDRLDGIESKIRELFPNAINETEEGNDNETPTYIMEKIERLFEEAHKDRSRINELKQELDRWELFKHYEDRFLDLFKPENDEKDEL
ncbi:MAG: hypothetical protein GF401_16635 [Chitinivibrionales bacterium]|nr:hypothetical protein [Chitinivibrionales bacterium]